MEIIDKNNNFIFDLIDQIFEIERKVNSLTEIHSINRNINRMKDIIEQIDPNGGLYYHDPVGEAYNETRTDVEVTVAGESAENLVISDVIKPIIRSRSGDNNIIARKGIVIVKSNQ